MKRFIAVLISTVLFTFPLLSVEAAAITTEKREYLPDGTYFVETVSDSTENESDFGIFARLMSFFRKLIEFFKGQKTVIKTKYLNYYSSEGELLWTAKLKGKFICSRSAVICSSADFSIDIFDSDWTLVSSSCSEQENTAIAEFSVRQTKLLVPLKTITKEMTLICDINGNVK